jgi:DNA-binding transcriptional LysR family regulator
MFWICDIDAVADLPSADHLGAMSVNLRRLDLNLLVVFDAVMQERSVTRAGQRVSLSQSAVSSALGRLREQLGDELFVRGPGKLRPTPRALELEVPVRAVLAELEQVLSPAQFDPATESRSFTIATNDYFTAVVAPPLARRLSRLAPNIDLRIVPTSGRAYEMLDQREADLVCTSVAHAPERFGTRVLIEDDYVCLVRRDHAFARRAPTLAQFARAKHLLVSPRGDASGWIDERLAERGLTRRVAMTVNHFAAAPQIVAETDYVLTVMRLVADRFAPSRQVASFDCPLAPPPALRRMSMIWHERLAQHPAHHWLRETLAEVGAGLGAGGSGSAVQ